MVWPVAEMMVCFDHSIPRGGIWHENVRVPSVFAPNLFQAGHWVRVDYHFMLCEIHGVVFQQYLNQMAASNFLIILEMVADDHCCPPLSRSSCIRQCKLCHVILEYHYTRWIRAELLWVLCSLGDAPGIIWKRRWTTLFMTNRNCYVLCVMHTNNPISFTTVGNGTITFTTTQWNNSTD